MHQTIAHISWMFEKSLGIWLAAWAVRYKAEWDYKLSGTARALRWGVIAASAGNHALGLAYHAQSLRIPATVVMPRFAPLTKVVNCRRLGAEVVLAGTNIAEARAHADQVAATRGLTYINGFDDPGIIAGQGTIGLEIAAQVPGVEAVVVPVGGAGLVAGIALAIKTLKPKVQVIGVAESAHRA